jgi:hypothetical protein
MDSVGLYSLINWGSFFILIDKLEDILRIYAILIFVERIGSYVREANRTFCLYPVLSFRDLFMVNFHSSDFIGFFIFIFLC